jgi:hypothetical protein
MRTRDSEMSADDDRLGWIDDMDVPVDVDALVGGGIRRGRQRVAARRARAAGTVAALSVLAIGVASLYRPGQVAAPAGAPTPTPSATTRTPSPSPTPSAASTRPSTGTFPTGAQVLGVIRARIPVTFKQSEILVIDDRAPGGSFTVTDALGSAWIGGGVGNQSDSPFTAAACKAPFCTVSMLDDQQLLTSVDAEKSGQGVWYTLMRADGTYVWLGQRSGFSGNGPATRPGRPLTDAQVMAILTDPAWDALLATMPTSR